MRILIKETFLLTDHSLLLLLLLLVDPSIEQPALLGSRSLLVLRALWQLRSRTRSAEGLPDAGRCQGAALWWRARGVGRVFWICCGWVTTWPFSTAVTVALVGGRAVCCRTDDVAGLFCLSVPRRVTSAWRALVRGGRWRGNPLPEVPRTTGSFERCPVGVSSTKKAFWAACRAREQLAAGALRSTKKAVEPLLDRLGTHTLRYTHVVLLTLFTQFRRTTKRPHRTTS